jgi:glutathione S-transferase
MKLYYFPGACSLATHIVLEWIGSPYDTVKLDLASTKSPEYLALNPDGAVPLLIDGDFVLSQNAAILYYLGERHPDARLLGDGSVRGRAEVLRWLSLLNSDVHPAFKPIFKPARFHPETSSSRVIADTARTHVREYLERLDARLQGRDWLAGQRSIADPYLFVMLRWAFKLKVSMKGLDNLARFFSRMSADAAVRAAIIQEEGRIGNEASAA